MKYKVFAINYKEGCAVSHCVPTYESREPEGSLSFDAGLDLHLERYLGKNTCLIHYAGVLSDGSNSVNSRRFIWTGYELHTY